MKNDRNDAEPKVDSQSDCSATIDRYEECFRRIAEAVGIKTPLMLLAMCDEETKTYAEALVKFVELKMSPNAPAERRVSP